MECMCMMHRIRNVNGLVSWPNSIIFPYFLIMSKRSTLSTIVND